MLLRGVLAGAIGLVFATAAVAHHSPAGYDQTTEMTFEGTITEVSWKNPHIYFMIETTGADGAKTVREIQAGSASGLTSMGVSAADFAIGEHVRVRGFPNRRGPEAVSWGLDITKDDGTTFPIDFFSRASSDRRVAPQEAASLAGRWLPPVAALRGPDLSGLLTDAGRAAQQDTASFIASQADCVPWPAPRMMFMPMQRDIAVNENTIELAFDWMGATRVIHMDQTEHPADVEPSLQGHSIGRWEGETLVIDTVGFEPNRSGLNTGIPSGPGKHLVERLSLTADKRQLHYEFTMEDPEYLAAPATFSEQWDHRPDLQPSGVECDEDVASRFLELE